ncbi:MAG TPA: hypothetical protein VKT25_12495 [Ktedonobacteraceae bacterium]|nr:hypothetical protein [Ktedonobacteraceae bacterium]
MNSQHVEERRSDGNDGSAGNAGSVKQGGKKSPTVVSAREKLADEETVALARKSQLADSEPSRLDEQQRSLLEATGGLAVILGQLVAYFHSRAHIDDLDALSFSLHHLFCRIDFLYSKALPTLMTLTSGQEKTGQAFHQDVRRRQQTWAQLHTINRTLDRMEPLCHLLSDATECILERFDASSEMLAFSDLDAELEVGALQPSEQEEDAHTFRIIDAERWEQAFSAVSQCLMRWQEHYTALAPFATQFAHLLSSISSLSEMDAAFATILDSAGAIFGDILPGFRAILSADEAMTAALLYDLMQQSDQLLMKFDTTLEPMTLLIKRYAVGPGLSS